MPDPIKMAVSHDQPEQPQGREDLTPQEMSALINHYSKQPIGQSNLPLDKFSPGDLKTLQQVQQSQRQPGKDATSNRADSAVAGNLPFINQINPEDLLMVGKALSGGKHLIGAGLRGGADALASGKGWGAGLGGMIKGMMGESGSVGPGVVGGGLEGENLSNVRRAPLPMTTTQPMSDAEFSGSSTGGRARGEFSPEKLNLGRRGGLTPDDLQKTMPREDMPNPPNLSFHRSNADLAETTSKGAGPGKGVFRPSPSSKMEGNAFSADTPQGHPAFEQSEKDTTDLMNSGMQEGDFKQQLTDSLKLRRRKP